MTSFKGAIAVFILFLISYFLADKK